MSIYAGMAPKSGCPIQNDMLNHQSHLKQLKLILKYSYISDVTSISNIHSNTSPEALVIVLLGSLHSVTNQWFTGLT